VSGIKIYEYLLQNEKKSKSKFITNKFNDCIKTSGLENLTKKNDSEFVFSNNQNSHAFKIKTKCHVFQHTFSKGANMSCIQTCILQINKHQIILHSNM